MSKACVFIYISSFELPYKMIIIIPVLYMEIKYS